MNTYPELLTIKEAGKWATQHLGKNVTASNISYLVQYGKVRRVSDEGITQINKQELAEYYKSLNEGREIEWIGQLGEDLNWALSFDQYKEADTTKHVHRLHPYKGKFIPQLVEYFLDDHIDNFKKQVYFEKGDIILDPFGGSGTTLVQSNELEMHAVGIDISAFNALIANCKVQKHDLTNLQTEIIRISEALRQFLKNSSTLEFEGRLLQDLYVFNNKYFPVPDFKYKVHQGLINGDKYGEEKSKEFLPTYQKLVDGYKIELLQPKSNTFLEKWFTQHIHDEIIFVLNEIKQVQNPTTREILSVVLSRTMRSCRATTHADLATLKDPVITTYYCAKHGKICKPIFSILKWWETYSRDTIKRLAAFDKLRSNTHQLCLAGDSRTVDIFNAIEAKSLEFGKLIRKQKIKGIFSSPPYVGLIDYHEQHAYAYDIFEFERKDDLEIGPLFKGQGSEARQSYIQGISDVLNNCKKYLRDDYDIFLVANDKYNMYPTIAKSSGMRIVNQYKRPVLNRTERDKGAYSEIIFHLKAE